MAGGSGSCGLCCLPRNLLPWSGRVLPDRECRPQFQENHHWSNQSVEFPESFLALPRSSLNLSHCHCFEKRSPGNATGETLLQMLVQHPQDSLNGRTLKFFRRKRTRSALSNQMIKRNNLATFFRTKISIECFSLAFEKCCTSGQRELFFGLGGSSLRCWKRVKTSRQATSARICRETQRPSFAFPCQIRLRLTPSGHGFTHHMLAARDYVKNHL